MLSDLAGFVDVGVGEALQGAAEEVGAPPAALDAQQALPHVSLRGGRLCVGCTGGRGGRRKVNSIRANSL